MDIIEILRMRGLDTEAQIKLVRHQDDRYDLADLHSKGLIEVYQSYQQKPIFHNCEYIVSFLGSDYGQASFVGVYRVNGHRPASEVPLPADSPFKRYEGSEKHYYDLEGVPGFEDLRDRVVIDWGGSPLAWHQWLAQKQILEILPAGYVTPFPGYLEVNLPYDQLVKIMRNKSANRDWHLLLAAVAGVYLILDMETGLQYVGSAYGDTGILGRWKVYAKQPHGGNVKLRALLQDRGPDYARNFRFSILHTLPRSSTKEHVIAWESKFKQKLGCKAFGLNSN